MMEFFQNIIDLARLLGPLGSLIMLVGIFLIVLFFYGFWRLITEKEEPSNDVPTRFVIEIEDHSTKSE